MEVVVVSEGGRPVAWKRAATSAEAARLEREAEVLRALAGTDGVPEVVRVGEVRTEPGVLTSLVVTALDAASLATAPALSGAALHALALGLARVLAAVHDRGFVHGAVEPGHVVLDEGRVLLCGFGAAGPEGQPSPDDPGRILRQADDVAGWGDVVAHLVDYAGAVAEPPARSSRWWKSSGESADPDAAVRAELLARADDARDPVPERRPSARALAVAIEHRLGTLGLEPRSGAAHGGPADPAEEPTAGGEVATPRPDPAVDEPQAGGRGGVRARRVAGAAAIALVVAAAAPAVLGRGRPAPGPAQDAESPPCAGEPPPAPAADVDGDGCPEAVRWVAGVVEAGRARFALGGAGDAVAFGDWDCDGSPTPALLHEGTVMVFDGWARRGEDVRGRPVTTVAGATALTAEPAADGCDRLLATGPGLAGVEVPT